MIPGLGLVRRTITLALLVAAFWAGVRLGTSGQQDACLDAGGTWDTRGYCEEPKEEPQP
ncbi:hypothetical protein [Pseudogemmobacter blasticus]|uniref:hypothetical protein n=1 Tax=Fuscovulum blasticum TaxID=1075 RepID=UPI0013DE7C5A|nr:hypothetical protein [Fuscovulum blasticum]